MLVSENTHVVTDRTSLEMGTFKVLLAGLLKEVSLATGREEPLVRKW